MEGRRRSKVKIVKVCRDTNSGTYEYFEEMVTNKENMANDTEYLGSNGAVRQRVMTALAATGYAGLAFVDKKVEAVKINGVAPYAAIARPLYLYSNGQPKEGSVLEWFVNLYKTKKGREIVEAIGFIPVE